MRLAREQFQSRQSLSEQQWLKLHWPDFLLQDSPAAPFYRWSSKK
jgi:hypothetical protein